jgi:hypothetical protein
MSVEKSFYIADIKGVAAWISRCGKMAMAVDKLAGGLVHVDGSEFSKAGLLQVVMTNL